MIRIVAGQPEDPALTIVTAAFTRSVTASQVVFEGATNIHVFVNPSEEQAAEIVKLLTGGAKILVFGSWPDASPIQEDWRMAISCPPAPVQEISISPAHVVWQQNPMGAEPPLGLTYPVKRFDFADEWNNLGYGAIIIGGPWGLANASAPLGAKLLATVTAPGLTALPYVALLDLGSSAFLWWNRPVGPVDHHDWALIEHFIADFGVERLPCQPVVEEVPIGHSAALTMRLDCDEDIGSATHLFELYRDRRLPFSLAVMTGQELRPDGDKLLKDVHASGGGILSHSATHAPNWGGSPERCAAELKESCDWIARHLPAYTPRHAVSPFHQSPAFLSQTLAKHGLTGFIGGIIANDPETLLARGGILPNGHKDVVTHSQQCMLHGDCMLSKGDPLQVPKISLAAAVKGRALFGYLDHPLSQRYDYGWGSLNAQLSAHVAMLDHIEAFYPKACWMSADDALDWIEAKSKIRLFQETSGRWSCKGPTALRKFRFAMRFKGKVTALHEACNA